MALNKLYELSLPSSTLLSLTWVTLLVIMILPYFFINYADKDTILFLLYVEDMIITGDNLSGIQELKDFLNQQFKIKDLRHLSYFVGLEITHSIDGLYITQAKYASELLSRAGLTDSKTIDTLVEFNMHLTPL